LSEGFSTIVAVGGDGTMNEVASALVHTPATLGLVPCGSGDGLGRHLRIHGSPAHALAILEAGHTRVIDSGLVNELPFFCAAGLGFEAEIAHRFNRLQRRGFLRYLTTSAAGYFAYQPEEYTITHHGGSERIRAFTLTVANSDQYGNDARIAPGAKIDDGLLNLSVIPPVNLLNSIPLGARLFHGSLHRLPSVFLRAGKQFIIERPRPGWLHTDGETHEAGTRLEFTVRPASLRVIAPPKRTD
jgi:diacylglycerol kinase (ATP)